MHLHDHAGVSATPLQPGIHRQHRPLDDICRGTLHGRIDGRAFGCLHPHLIAGIDLWQVEPATKQRFHISLFFGQGPGPVHVVQNPRVTFKIPVYVLLGLLATQV